MHSFSLFPARFFAFLLAVTILISPANESAVAGVAAVAKYSTVATKVLPLDGLPNVEMKTREKSIYFNDRVIVKLMPHAQANVVRGSFRIGTIDNVLRQISVVSIEPMFPPAMVERQKGDVDLSRFFTVKYTSPEDPFSVSEQLSQLADVHYAEPWFIHTVSGQPNDPMFAQQWALTRIQAVQAWNVTQGDTSVIIGIVDSGVQLAHPDLAANIWYNHGETGMTAPGDPCWTGTSEDKRFNNCDDDGNGYVDDWRGWDFGGANYANIVPDNDPNPTASNNAHGTHVAGDASAVTNNNVGVAGIGYRSRILAVKTTADNDTRAPGGLAYIIAGIQGIAYAAHVGAHVINCSWGGGGGSQFEQDIINYATAQGSLVVAAAGNSNSSAAHFPSGYRNVISVAASNSNDVKAPFSNYGMRIDITSPGVNILSTAYSNTYQAWDGTSMASPIAAGVAALIRAVQPGYTAQQLGQQLRVTADNIDGANPGFVSMLGKGRINAHRAVTQFTSPAIRMHDFVMRDSSGGNNNGVPEPNETLDLYFTFVNYLTATSNASVTLSTTSSFISIVNGTFTLGAVGTLDTVRNTGSPLRVHVSGTAPPSHVAALKLNFSDGTYSDYQWVTLVVNPTFQTHNVGNVAVTMTNNGRIGFNDYFQNTQGVGFVYPAGAGNHLFEGGLIMGTSSTRLVNNIRQGNQTTQNNDFLARQVFQLTTPGVISHQDGYTWFSDSAAPSTNRIGLRVDKHTYMYSDPGEDDFVIVRYEIRNLNATTVESLYVGVFLDWDVLDLYASNRTDCDASRNMSYAWDNNTPTTPYLGLRALDTAYTCRALAIQSFTNLTRAQKWAWLKSEYTQPALGPIDIATVVASGPYTIGPAQKQTVGFALVGGASLAHLQANADVARAKWDEILQLVSVPDGRPMTPHSLALEQNYPNPFNPTTNIRFSIPQGGEVSLRVFDVLGRQVDVLVSGELEAGIHEVAWKASSIPTGLYFYELRASGNREVRKLILLK